MGHEKRERLGGQFGLDFPAVLCQVQRALQTGVLLVAGPDAHRPPQRKLDGGCRVLRVAPGEFLLVLGLLRGELGQPSVFAAGGVAA